MRVLVTGGAGYIGSHTCLELVASGESVLVLDNLSNSSVDSLLRVSEIVGCDFELLSGFESLKVSEKSTIYFVKGDINNISLLNKIFMAFDITSIIHFAGLKAVGESVKEPLMYYYNNVSGTLSLLEVAEKFNCQKFIFSSSATVYGLPDELPIKEDFGLSATNPYGESKLIVENILKDLVEADSNWSIMILRYFNPVGAHESGYIGEDPKGTPNNIMPYISQVAMGLRDFVNIFGADYNTSDGTGVRDYIHVVDLALGHMAAIKQLYFHNGINVVNLGTGKGYSVLELIKAYGKAADKTIPYKIVERRDGDVAACYSDPSFAFDLLGWKARFDICKMCEDSWRWQSRNPSGYKKNE